MTLACSMTPNGSMKVQFQDIEMQTFLEQVQRTTTAGQTLQLDLTAEPAEDTEVPIREWDS